MKMRGFEGDPMGPQSPLQQNEVYMFEEAGQSVGHVRHNFGVIPNDAGASDRGIRWSAIIIGGPTYLNIEVGRTDRERQRARARKRERER